MPSTLVPLNKASQPISAARSAAAVSVVKKGLPVPAANSTIRPFLEMPERAAADVGLGHARHRDRRLDAGVDAELLERILQRKRVHDGRQHAHVIGGGAIEALGRRGHAAEDVAAADDQAQLVPLRLGRGDLTGKAGDRVGIDPELALAPSAPRPKASAGSG